MNLPGESFLPRGPCASETSSRGFFRRLGEAIEYLRSKEQREAAVLAQALEQLQSRARPEDAELLNGLTALVETKRRTVGPKTG